MYLRISSQIIYLFVLLTLKGVLPSFLGKNMCYEFLFSVKRPFWPGKDFRRKRGSSLVLLSSQREMFPDLGQAAVPMPRSAITVPKRKNSETKETRRELPKNLGDTVDA